MSAGVQVVMRDKGQNNIPIVLTFEEATSWTWGEKYFTVSRGGSAIASLNPKRVLAVHGVETKVTMNELEY